MVQKSQNVVRCQRTEKQIVKSPETALKSTVGVSAQVKSSFIPNQTPKTINVGGGVDPLNHQQVASSQRPFT